MKGANQLRSQTYQAEAAPQSVIPSFAGGRDLVSMRDLSPVEVEALFHLTSLVKTRPEDFRTALAGKHIAMFFEKPSLRLHNMTWHHKYIQKCTFHSTCLNMQITW